MVDPIEPILKTSRSSARTTYEVSGNSATTFAAPTGTASVTVYFGDTAIASDDSTYPWTLNSAGNVVFTGRSPRDGQIITVVANDLGLDLDKVNFPKGYSLDSRVFNRTLNSALYTANELWATGSDLFDTWRDLNVLPSPGALDDRFAITDNGAWQVQNATQAGNILEDGLFGDLIVDSVSANSFSSVNMDFGTVDSFSATLPSATVGPYTESYLYFNTDFPSLSGGFISQATSGIEVDASGAIQFFVRDYDQFNASGYWSRNAAATFANSNADLTKFNNYVSDNSNMVIANSNVISTNKVNSWIEIDNTDREHVKAWGVPVTCLRTSGSISLNLDDYSNSLDFVRVFYPTYSLTAPNTQGPLYKPLVSTLGDLPSIGAVTPFAVYNDWDGTFPATGEIKLMLGLLIQFNKALITNGAYTVKPYDVNNAYRVDGYTKLKVTANTANNTTTEIFSQVEPQFGLIGSPFYTGYANTWFANGIGNTITPPSNLLPRTTSDESQLGKPIFSHAIIILDPDFSYSRLTMGSGYNDTVDYEVELVMYQTDEGIFE